MTIVKSPRKRSYYNPVAEGRKPKQLRLPIPTESSFDSAPITVTVGDSKKTFFVHETLISNNSAFFKIALKREWKEGVTRTVELPDIDPATFRIYVDWLYTGPRFNFTKQDDKVYTTETLEKSFTTSGSMAQRPQAAATMVPSVDHEWIRWHQCYELGNYLQDTDFKDALVDMAIEKMCTDNEYTLDFPKYIYPTSTGQSPHRKLAADIAVKVWSSHSLLAAPKANYPSEFLADVLAELGPKVRSGSVTETDIYDYLHDLTPCKYHEHTLGTSACYFKKRALGA